MKKHEPNVLRHQRADQSTLSVFGLITMTLVVGSGNAEPTSSHPVPEIPKAPIRTIGNQLEQAEAPNPTP